MKYILTPLTVAACLWLGWFVYQDSLDATQQPAAEQTPEAVAVEVTRVLQRTIEDRIDLVGSLQATAAVEIRARISGYIKRLPYDVGDYIEADQVTVELDDSQNREMVARAEAALKVAKAQLAAKQAEEQLVRDNVQRFDELAKSGVTTQQEREQEQAQLAITAAQVTLEQARVAQAESDLLQSKLALAETRITSPFAGFLAERFVEAGDLAQPNLPLVRIVDISTVQTIVHVVERDYERVQQDQSAVIYVDAFPGQPFHGRVIRKSPILDPQTRTATVQIEFDNEQYLLKPGMHARVRIVFERRKRANVVPIAALIDGLEEPSLYIVEGTPAVSRLVRVKTGILDGDDVEILDGLDAEHRVVTLGSRLIRDGQVVQAVDVSPVDEPVEVETPVERDPTILSE